MQTAFGGLMHDLEIDAFVHNCKYHVIEHSLIRPLLRSEYILFRFGSAFVVNGEKRQAAWRWQVQPELADQPGISCKPTRSGKLTSVKIHHRASRILTFSGNG